MTTMKLTTEQNEPASVTTSDLTDGLWFSADESYAPWVCLVRGSQRIAINCRGESTVIIPSGWKSSTWRRAQPGESFTITEGPE